MKKIYIGYCQWTYSTIFLDENMEYITDIHENDGDWREDYFNPILKHIGIEVTDPNFDQVLIKFSKKLENGTIGLSEIKFKELIKP